MDIHVYNLQIYGCMGSTPEQNLCMPVVSHPSNPRRTQRFPAGSEGPLQTCPSETIQGRQGQVGRPETRSAVVDK